MERSAPFRSTTMLSDASATGLSARQEACQSGSPASGSSMLQWAAYRASDLPVFPIGPPMARSLLPGSEGMAASVSSWKFRKARKPMSSCRDARSRCSEAEATCSGAHKGHPLPRRGGGGWFMLGDVLTRSLLVIQGKVQQGCRQFRRLVRLQGHRPAISACSMLETVRSVLLEVPCAPDPFCLPWQYLPLDDGGMRDARAGAQGWAA